MLGKTSLASSYRSYRRSINIGLPLFPWSTRLSNAVDHVGIAVNVLIAAILAMISTIIGVNLIGPVATAVGGALKNGNLTGAANSITAQLTLLFVVIVVLIPVVFIAVFGKIAQEAA